MTTATATSVGTFVWYDLMTLDLPKARAFYRELFPEWAVEAVKVVPGMPAIDIIAAGGIPTGDLIPLDAAHGLPSHWIGYVDVANIGSTLALAEEHGGKVVMPAMQIPGIGSFALIQDPCGAYIKTIQLENPSMLPERAVPGQVCWAELMSSNIDEAKNFYAAVFGWTLGGMDMGPTTGFYTVFNRGERMVAGGMKMPFEGAPSFWQYYFLVPDVDARAAKAVSLGATMTVPEAFDVPGVGRMAFLADPTGAAFALHAPAAA